MGQPSVLEWTLAHSLQAVSNDQKDAVHQTMIPVGLRGECTGFIQRIGYQSVQLAA